MNKNAQRLVSAEALATALARQDLSDHMDAGCYRLFDCRFDLADKSAGQRAYDEGHLPGAIFADLEKDLSAPLSETSGRHPLPESGAFAARLGEWGLTPDDNVVVYDDHGGAFALRLWWMLRWAGHRRVGLLDGGVRAWLEQGNSLERAEVDFKPTVYPASFTRGDWLTTPELESELAEANCLLLDARSEARFAGRAEPIDTRAGHIPGAHNLDFTANLDSHGRFLNEAQLRRRFAAIVSAAGSPERVVHMCGSGVTACHNLFAMELAGWGGSRLYPGSWSEWIRDPARPVVP